MYEPTTQATANIEGTPAARYEVPPEAPRGEVNVASLGIVDLSVDQNGPKTRFLQIRMIAANNNDTGPWVIDSREQLLSLANEGQSRPAFVNTDRQDAPNITVAPTQKRTIDLFYPLPEPLAKANSVSQFDLLWHVQTPSREVAERTPFQGVSVDTGNADAYAYGNPYGYDGAYAYDGAYGYDIGWGSVWWYDPFFAGVTFAHPGFFRAPRAFFAHPFFGPGHVHVVGRAGGFHGHPGAFAGRPGGFAGGRPPGTFHAGASGFHGGGGGFHGGGGGFHGGGGGGFHGGGGGGSHGGGGGGGGHR